MVENFVAVNLSVSRKTSVIVY